MTLDGLKFGNKKTFLESGNNKGDSGDEHNNKGKDGVELGTAVRLRILQSPPHSGPETA